MGSRLENNSKAVRKRIENHTFDNEEGEEYESSNFGGFTDYFRRKKIKLQNLDAELRSQSSEKPKIFRGIVAHVNGYTQPSLNDLHKLIVSYGGGFMQYLDGKTTVTHIIASNLTPKKAVEFKKYRIVKPAWIVDSVEAGKLLPWDSYRVVDEGPGQKLLGFDGGKIVSETNKSVRSYRDQTDKSWYTSQIKEQSSIPSSTNGPRFLSQRPPTPQSDEIVEDLPELKPTSNAPLVNQSQEFAVPDDFFDGATPNTPPQTSQPSQTKESPEASTETGAKPLPQTTNDDIDKESPTKKRAHSPILENPSKRTKLTAEEHNAILLADPKIRKSSVVDPKFLEQYYRESRLHHLSTWKADLKSQLQALASEKSSSQKQRQKPLPGARKYVMHVDFDSFFAAVSLKKNPEYRDKPAVVAHGNGSGSEIASCNYPAREFGIKNGMWMKRAMELCPTLKVLPYDFPAYEETSRAFYDVILATDGLVQSVSIDEALVDISVICANAAKSAHSSEDAIHEEQTKAAEIAQRLRDDVLQRTGCHVSVGIGGNILQAKAALRKAKPAGQYHLKPEEVLDFIGKLDVQNLPGVAWSIGGKLEEIGIKMVQDIRQCSKEKLVATLGPKTGEKLWEYSRGIDKSEVGDVPVRKSVSAEVNWGVRFENQTQADEFIESLCVELHKRLVKEGVKGRQFTMKIMRRAADAPLDPPKHLGHGKCDTYNKSIVLGLPTNAINVLSREALSILKGFNFSPGELRGIGVQMTKLEPVKSDVNGNPDGSQRRLQFKNTTDSVKPVVEDRKLQFKNTTDSMRPVSEDPIQDDVTTPKKPRSAPDQIHFGPNELNQSTPRKKPLNTLGTQFILPTQVDPKILEELPDDIRAKLSKHVRPTSPTPGPKRPPASTFLPSESQLDPDTLSALPDDLRAEVLAHYQQDFVKPRSRDQSVLPQSPRKNRVLPPPRKPIAPVGRRRGRPPKNAVSVSHTSAITSGSTLTQANFVTSRPTSRGAGGSDALTTTEIDAEFLAALPEDIRSEVLAQQRRDRLSAKSALSIPAARKARLVQQPSAPPSKRVLRLPPRKPRPTFTTQKLHLLDDLREALNAWLKEFRDEGPYEEDVSALGKYLASVVTEERDMDKAVGVVRWLDWLVSDAFEDDEIDGTPKDTQERGRKGWREAVVLAKNRVRRAVFERGLGEVDF